MNNTAISLPPLLLIGLLGLTAGGLLLLAGLAVGQPILLGMGLRNALRRPAQTSIMLAGLTLAAAFITTSLGLSDSVAASTAAYRLAQVGAVDETVTGPLGADQADKAISSIARLPQVAGVAGISVSRLDNKLLLTRTGLTTPDIDVFAVPPQFDQVYGPINDAQGQPLRFADLAAGQVLLSKTATLLSGAQPGDSIQINLGYTTITATVQATLSTDVVVTGGELAFTGAYPEAVISLAWLQQIYAQINKQALAPNALCIKNSGIAGTGSSDTSSAPVTAFLYSLFHTAPGTLRIPTDFGVFTIHPLQPDIVNYQGFSPLASKPDMSVSPAARQFALLLPAFASLLVGASILLLLLLCLLLAAERRATLGMARAIGLSRGHLVLVLVFEGCAYGVVAALLGVPVGAGATVLELAALNLVPAVAGPFSPQHAARVPLQLSLSISSAIGAAALSLLITLVVVLLTALWISRLNIVAAIRDVDAAPPVPVTPRSRLASLRIRAYDAGGVLLPESGARRRERRLGAGAGLLIAFALGGFLALLSGAVLLLWAEQRDLLWAQELAVALLVAGVGRLSSRLLLTLRVGARLSRLAGLCLAGVGLLYAGLSMGYGVFLFAFLPDLAGLNSTRDYTLLDMLTSLLLPIAGAVLLAMGLLDVLARFAALLTERLAWLVPASRLALAYPLSSRSRTAVTVTLLSMVTFLLMLLVTNNLGQIQQQQISAISGGFQLEIGVDPREQPGLIAQLAQLPSTLPRSVAAVALLRGLDLPGKGVHLELAGRPEYITPGGPMDADDTFLALTSLPMIARAQGFGSDRAVWNGVRDESNYAVLQYKSGLGIPTGSGFTPFKAEIPSISQTPDDLAPVTRLHEVTIIGIMPTTAHWPTILFSRRTAAGIMPYPNVYLPYYYVRLQPGVTIVQGSGAVSGALHLGQLGVSFNSLLPADQNSYTAYLTLFLSGYLALGLVFGALCIGVITSRAVVERRQQIGLLRALGFSRRLVLGSFLLEATFVIGLSLALGTSLAWFVVARIAYEAYQTFPVPWGAVSGLLGGSFLLTIVCTVLPARQAAGLPPAEALRYE